MDGEKAGWAGHCFKLCECPAARIQRGIGHRHIIKFGRPICQVARVVRFNGFQVEGWDEPHEGSR